jgi:hypothetical protein
LKAAVRVTHPTSPIAADRVLPGITRGGPGRHPVVPLRERLEYWRCLVVEGPGI